MMTSIRSLFALLILVCFLYTWIIFWSCSCEESGVGRPLGGRASARNERGANGDGHIRTGDSKEKEQQQHGKKKTFLLVTVLSSPGDSAVRAVLRDTWLRLSSKGKDVVTVVFAMGTAGLSALERGRLEEEQALAGDLAILPSLHEHYSNLTRKTLETMVWAWQEYEFEFLLKADSDSFIRLGALLKALRDIAHPRLYWGFLDGRAKPIRKGKWREADWILCDRYLPYQLGGGYVLAAELVGFLATNARLFKMYKNEDVAVGAWLAGLDVKYVHDPRFDTEFRSRGCSNQYLITHKKTPADMLALYHSITTSQRLCEREYRVRGSYVYDWSGAPSECCHRSNTSNIP